MFDTQEKILKTFLIGLSAITTLLIMFLGFTMIKDEFFNKPKTESLFNENAGLKYRPDDNSDKVYLPFKDEFKMEVRTHNTCINENTPDEYCLPFSDIFYNHEMTTTEFIQLLIDQEGYTYEPEEASTTPAKLIK